MTGGTGTINPGIYTKIAVSDASTLTMNPRIYIIAGGDLSVTGSASVKVGSVSDLGTGNGVLIYNAGSIVLGGFGTPTYGGITLSGTGNFNLVAPTTGNYSGIGIFQARDNRHLPEISPGRPARPSPGRLDRHDGPAARDPPRQFRAMASLHGIFFPGRP